jgi:hypothetical protein
MPEKASIRKARPRGPAQPTNVLTALAHGPDTDTDTDNAAGLIAEAA